MELSQKVKLDIGSEKEVEQSVSIDSEDGWLCLTHDGNSIVLSPENWEKLKELADQVLTQM